MNNKIICMLQPFAFNQQIYIYQSGNKIDTLNSTIDALNQNLIQLLDKYTDINKIEVLGPKNYAKGIGKNIEKELLTKYEMRNIIIEYI